jgi:hypothetical protein
MTETEWLACSDPGKMLEFLRSSGASSDHKVRLFLAACCRAAWHLVKARKSREAVEVAERYAEGSASERERKVMCGAAWKVTAPPGGEYAAAYLAARSLDNPINADWGYADEMALPSLVRHSGTLTAAAQCHMVSDLFGTLPFRPVPLDPSWWTAHVVVLAQAIYDQRAFERMPELGEALERAGCSNKDILDHCRQAGEHVRGCWVVDLILGKG